MRLILASSSPRRKELLSEIINSEKLLISVNSIEEIYTSTKPKEIVKELAILKGLSKSEEFPNDMVISADTIVVHRDKILGKPKDNADAISTLKLLSGDSHSVFSGVAIFINGKIETIIQESVIEFYDLSYEIIKKYVESGDAMDKAGSYGIQGFAKLFVKKISGNYNNIVGFPISKFYNKYKHIIEEINNDK